MTGKVRAWKKSRWVFGGPIAVGDRWRSVEATTGKNLVGPFYVEPTIWAVEGWKVKL